LQKHVQQAAIIDLKYIKSKHQYADQLADVCPAVQDDVKILNCFIHENKMIKKWLMAGSMTE
jgi:hypothetical protein